MRQPYDTLFAQGHEAARLGQLLPDACLRHPTTDTQRGLTLPLLQCTIGHGINPGYP
ncbi:hypothetical protein Q5H93_17525 [Hymenobacter sp. ASUV-10]|uniref:Uncharacterized protein n=1 Tax=Hymenobacter aranciens TaxID=3063996 RepID=A0ABT9BFT3_9BACT|nr:hypothetical protein [Hymenobacter sp. ASUV-10]MDO7876549.1 hypothetical protein [Hymenobacter sp. ASUV-10]